MVLKQCWNVQFFVQDFEKYVSYICFKLTKFYNVLSLESTFFFAQAQYIFTPLFCT